MRKERDSLGEKDIKDVYYGIHTARAIENFDIKNKRVNEELIKAIALIKIAAAEANKKAGKLDENIANAIKEAASDLVSGNYADVLVLPSIQGGAGTSTNMCVNEVIANIALEKMGHNKGEYNVINPLDHVNHSQSTNDVYPTAVKIASIKLLRELLDETMALQQELQNKEKEFSNVLKTGRTQFQDAVPLTLGQEFGAYAEAISRDRWRIYKIEERIRRVNIGGTAIGTGVGASGKYRYYVTEELQRMTGFGLARAENLIDATQNLDVYVEVHSLLKTMAVNLNKIARDLRIMSSKPFSEISLEPLQAGSTIMPGKINPVGAEFIQQIYYKICGNDLTLTMACGDGELELNAMHPIIAEVFLESFELLRDGIRIFREKVVKNIKVNTENCKKHLENSITKASVYIEKYGYDRLAELIKESQKTGKKIEELMEE